MLHARSLIVNARSHQNWWDEDANYKSSETITMLKQYFVSAISASLMRMFCYRPLHIYMSTHNAALSLFVMCTINVLNNSFSDDIIYIYGITFTVFNIMFTSL